MIPLSERTKLAAAAAAQEAQARSDRDKVTAMRANNLGFRASALALRQILADKFGYGSKALWTGDTSGLRIERYREAGAKYHDEDSDVWYILEHSMAQPMVIIPGARSACYCFGLAQLNDLLGVLDEPPEPPAEKPWYKKLYHFLDTPFRK